MMNDLDPCLFDFDAYPRVFFIPRVYHNGKDQTHRQINKYTSRKRNKLELKRRIDRGEIHKGQNSAILVYEGHFSYFATLQEKKTVIAELGESQPRL